MMLDLTHVLLRDGEVLEKTVPLAMEEFSLQTGKFPILRRSPLRLTVVNAGTESWT